MIEAMDSGERGMNPVAMNVINLWEKNIGRAWGTNQQTPVLKSNKPDYGAWLTDESNMRKIPSILNCQSRETTAEP